MMTQQYIRGRVESLTNRRAADLAKSGTPGPEGSLGKLLWTEGMRTMTETVAAILGPKLIADTGEWGTFEWGEHVLGAPGYRIAGGSDEVQRNIIGERVLGLPPRTPRRHRRLEGHPALIEAGQSVRTGMSPAQSTDASRTIA